MSTWVNWTRPFDFSSLQDTIITIRTPQVVPHVATPSSYHYFTHVFITFL